MEEPIEQKSMPPETPGYYTIDPPLQFIGKINWRKWRLMDMRFYNYPDTLSGWLWMLWFMDIHVCGWFPLLKFTVLLCFIVSHV